MRTFLLETQKKHTFWSICENIGCKLAYVCYHKRIRHVCFYCGFRIFYSVYWCMNLNRCFSMEKILKLQKWISYGNSSGYVLVLGRDLFVLSRLKSILLPHQSFYAIFVFWFFCYFRMISLAVHDICHFTCIHMKLKTRKFILR